MENLEKNIEENTEELIRQYISKDILYTDGKYPYADDASLLDQGIIDSMNVLQLILFIEKQFGISVPDQDVVPDHFDSVSRMAAYAQSKSPRLAAQPTRP
jgi:acyl carrier protein